MTCPTYIHTDFVATAKVAPRGNAADGRVRMGLALTQATPYTLAGRRKS